MGIHGWIRNHLNSECLGRPWTSQSVGRVGWNNIDGTTDGYSPRILSRKTDVPRSRGTQTNGAVGIRPCIGYPICNVRGEIKCRIASVTKTRGGGSIHYWIRIHRDLSGYRGTRTSLSVGGKRWNGRNGSRNGSNAIVGCCKRRDISIARGC